MTSVSNAASKIKSTAKSVAGKYLDNDPRNTPYFDDNQFFKQLDDRNKWTINDRNNQYDKVLGDTGRQFDKAQSINDRRTNESDARNDARYQQERLDNAWTRSNAQSMRSGGGSEAFGLGAAAPSGYSLTPYGFSTIYDRSGVANWRDRQNSVLDDQYRQAKRMAGIDRDNQESAAIKNNIRDIDMMNRQTSLRAQQEGNQRIYQSGEADKDRNNQRYIAQLDANTRMYSSMFNGNGNGFQYWGGSI